MSQQPAFAFPTVLLLFAGGLGPALAALILIWRTSDAAQRHDYFVRIYDVRRIPLRWHLAIWLLIPALTLLAIAVAALAGYPADFTNAARLLRNPIGLVGTVLFLFVFGPLVEEVGWRGYALDALQARRSAFVASLILGVVWGAWHLPLFFMNGTYQAGLGVGTAGFWWFMFTAATSSVLYTWIFNNTARSTLSAILFHFVINSTGEFLTPNPAAQIGQGVAIFFVAMLVTLVYGPHRLTRSSQ